MRQDIQYDLVLTNRLSEMRFPEPILHAWLRDARNTTATWASISRAAELLGLKEQVMYELVAWNFLVADVIANDGRAFRRNAFPSLQKFNETYIALAELAKQQPTSSRWLLHKIATRPVTGLNIDGAQQSFFRRADLAAPS